MMGNRASASAVYRPVGGSAQTLAVSTGGAVAASALSGHARHVIIWGEVAFRLEIGNGTATANSAALPASAPFSFIAYNGETISVLGLDAGNVHIWEATA